MKKLMVKVKRQAAPGPSSVELALECLPKIARLEYQAYLGRGYEYELGASMAKRLNLVRVARHEAEAWFADLDRLTEHLRAGSIPRVVAWLKRALPLTTWRVPRKDRWKLAAGFLQTFHSENEGTLIDPSAPIWLRRPVRGLERVAYAERELLAARNARLQAAERERSPEHRRAPR